MWIALYLLGFLSVSVLSVAFCLWLERFPTRLHDHQIGDDELLWSRLLRVERWLLVAWMLVTTAVSGSLMKWPLILIAFPLGFLLAALSAARIWRLLRPVTLSRRELLGCRSPWLILLPATLVLGMLLAGSNQVLRLRVRLAERSLTGLIANRRGPEPSRYPVWAGTFKISSVDQEPGGWALVGSGAPASLHYSQTGKDYSFDEPVICEHLYGSWWLWSED